MVVALPQLDDLLVALVVGDQAALELLVDRGDGLVGAFEQLAVFCLGHDDVPQADRQAAAGGEREADVLDAVDEVRRLGGAEQAVAGVDEALEVDAASSASLAKRSSGRAGPG